MKRQPSEWEKIFANKANDKGFISKIFKRAHTLPLPAFDGGHVLFIIIEKIKGSRVNPKVENIIHTIGLILLMILQLDYNKYLN